MRSTRRARPAYEAVLFDPKVIDLVAISPDGRRASLYVVCDATWTGSDDQIHSLQEKIHNYVGFARDGQLVTLYPEVEALPWEIVITCRAGPPDSRTADVLARTVKPVKACGGDLRVESSGGI